MKGKEAKATGWFRRSSYQVMDLDTIEIEIFHERIKSYTKFWGIAIGIFLIFLGIIPELI